MELTYPYTILLLPFIVYTDENSNHSEFESGVLSKAKSIYHIENERTNGNVFTLYKVHS